MDWELLALGPSVSYRHQLCSSKKKVQRRIPDNFVEDLPSKLFTLSLLSVCPTGQHRLRAPTGLDPERNGA